jgi:molecular chaperone DnaJ
MEDLYQILELDRNCSQDDIKKSYRKLSKKYHPDVNSESGAEDKFKKISEAYAVLSDPEKRQNYDRFGNSGGNPFGGGGNPFGGFNNMNDIFGDIFGGGNPFGNPFSRPQQQRGSDLRLKVTVTIDDVLNGVTKKLRYKRLDTCNVCSGKGGTNPRNCIPCNGTGQRTVVQNTPFGQIRQTATCPDCSGSGQVISDKCTSCRGDGTQQIDQTVDVEIPRGVSNGMQLTMHGYGNSAKNGVTGNLIIFIEEIPHNEFKREHNNIIIEKTISVIDAIVGSTVKVNTPTGEIPITIEQGTEHGKTIRMSGKGIPDLNLGLGDLFIKILLKIPKKINLDEKYQLEKMKNSDSFRV